MCHVTSEALLDDILESEKMLRWHDSIQALEVDDVLHFNLNHQANAFERLEHYLRNTLHVMAQPKQSLHSCVACLK